VPVGAADERGGQPVGVGVEVAEGDALRAQVPALNTSSSSPLTFG
jgi:hypothetical protein